MKAVQYALLSVEIKLDRHEEFVHRFTGERSQNFAMYVNSITYSGDGNVVVLSGPSYNQGGERGMISRSATVKLSALRESHLKEVREAVLDLQGDVEDRLTGGIMEVDAALRSKLN